MTTKRKDALSMKTLNELAINRKNKFILVTRDETMYWREDIANAAKKIEAVYLIDLSKPTHLCELSVNYYAHFISNFFHDIDAWRDKNGDATDELADMERDNGGECGCYFNGNSTFKIHKIYGSGTIEDAIEYEQCNPTYC